MNKLIQLPILIDSIERKVIQMSVDLSKLTQDVAAMQTVTQSALTLIQGIAAQLAAIPPSTDPATQAALDQLSTELESNTKALSDAVAANTAAPAPTPAPATPPAEAPPAA
jgi:small-conductance mechanosensitive channel